MSRKLDECLAHLVDEGKISDTDAEGLKNSYERRKKSYQKYLGLETSARRALADELAERAANNARARYLKALQIKAEVAIDHRLNSHAQGPAQGGMALLSLDLTGHHKHFDNVAVRAEQIQALAHQQLDEVLSLRGHYNVDKVRESAMVKALFDEPVDPSSQALANQWRNVSEQLRQMFNQAGGQIAKRVDWRLPQTHDSDAIRAAGFDKWLKALGEQTLDKTAKVHGLTRADLDVALESTYEAIITENATRQDPSKLIHNGTALANKYGQERFIQFANSDEFLSYNREFGRADIYNAMMNHIDRMAGDIARLEILGPNPDSQIAKIIQKVRHHESLQNLTDVVVRKGSPFAATANQIQNTYDVLAGRTSDHNGWSKILGDVRAIQQTAQLGSAVVTSVTDTGIVAITSHFNGLPVIKVMKRAVRQFRITDPLDRKIAAKSAIIADSAARTLASAARFDEFTGRRWTHGLVDNFHRTTLLTQWVTAWKEAFQLEFFATLADVADQPLTAVNKRLQAAMRRYGLDDVLWDQIRGHQDLFLDIEGEKFFDPGAFIRHGTDSQKAAALALHRMVLSERQYAVLEPNAQIRGLMLAGSKAGNLGGELVRSFWTYKSFVVSYMMMHLMRMTYELTSGKSRIGYGLALLLSTSALGGLAIQSKSIRDGKEPRPFDANFAMAALLQGGGLGIFGDFLYSGINRADLDLAATIAGPMAGLGKDVVSLPFKAMRDFREGGDITIGADLVQFFQRNLPGTNIWYSKLATDRLLWDLSRHLVDPNADRHFRRMEKRAFEEMGTEYFWAPGALLPAALH